ncbi:MAG: sulfatase family protein, partial [Planctomycetia bacterium]
MNVVVIVVDCLHLGYLGCYGCDWVDTPAVDRLAHDGFVFDHFYPENPTRGGALHAALGGTPRFTAAVGTARSPLADLLTTAGVRTAFFSNHPDFDPASPPAGFDQSAAFVEESIAPERLAEVDAVRAHPHYRMPTISGPRVDQWIDRWRAQVGRDVERNVVFPAVAPKRDPDDEEGLLDDSAYGDDDDTDNETNDDDTDDDDFGGDLDDEAGEPASSVGETPAVEDDEPTSLDRLFAAAGQFLADPSESPRFLWIDASIQASSWLPAPAERVQYADEENPAVIVDPLPGLVSETLGDDDLNAVQAGYAAKVSTFDAVLGAFLEMLDDAGRRDDTVVVLTADQGMPMGEHDVVGPPAGDQAAVGGLYEERMHVPLVVRWPGCRGTGRSLALVQSGDLYPTLRAAFAAEPDDAAVGKNLLSLLQGEPSRVRDYACSGVDDRVYTLRTLQWKLVLPMASGGDQPPPPRELFAKPEDRWDNSDVAEQNREVADQLELHLRRYLDAV